MDDLLEVATAQVPDSIASFSSRGPSRQGAQAILKPDLTAPGVSVVSTAAGTGSGAATYSGTSMAAPLTSGVVALIRQAHPTWSPADVKALMMNTAGHDAYLSATPRPANRVSPLRAGAGRIDAAAALGASVIAYDKAAPGRVSISFATSDVAVAVTEPRTIQLKNTGTTPVTYDVTIDPAVAPPGTTVAAVNALVTVAPVNLADVTVQLTADPAAMLRARDATVSATAPVVAAGSFSRLWLSEVSGWVVFTPQGTGNGPVLRVPYFAAATPASAMHATGPLSTVGGPAGVNAIALAGTGVDTRGLAAAPAGVVSLVTPFELAYASPKGPPLGGPLPAGYAAAETDNANIRYVGVTSNLPDVGLAAAEVYFGVTTFGLWGAPNDVEFDIYIRQAGAPDWEYVLFNGDWRPPGVTASNVHVSKLVNLANPAGGVIVEDLVNGVPASLLHVPTFLSDTMVLPVIVTDLFPGASTAFEYQVVSFSSGTGLPVDATPVLRYDPQAPAFSTSVDVANLPALAPAAGGGYAPFQMDADLGGFPVAYDLARARQTQTGAMLLVHHHNAAGQRAEKVAVQGLTCATNADCAGSPATPVCDVASGACVGCLTNSECTGAGAYCDSAGTRTCLTPDCRRPGAPACAPHFSCSTDYGTCQPNQELVLVLPVPPNSICPAGGQQINTGFDDNRNGVLDPSEIRPPATSATAPPARPDRPAPSARPAPPARSAPRATTAAAAPVAAPPPSRCSPSACSSGGVAGRRGRPARGDQGHLIETRASSAIAGGALGVPGLHLPRTGLLAQRRRPRTMARSISRFDSRSAMAPRRSSWVRPLASASSTLAQPPRK